MAEGKAWASFTQKQKDAETWQQISVNADSEVQVRANRGSVVMTSGALSAEMFVSEETVTCAQGGH